MPIEMTRRLAGSDLAAVEELLAAALAADGEQMQLVDGAVGFVARSGGRAGRAGGAGRPVGYAQLARGSAGWSLELVVAPQHRADVATDLIRAAIDFVEGEAGGRLQLWVRHVQPGDDRAAAVTGLEPQRDLFQMRRPLPVNEDWELSTRPFRPGLDDEAWLAVNSRAFDWHPEQGSWDVATLKARESEPWFDADGFLLHVFGGRLAGFCWTKIHAHLDPPLGEIYVIGVDPDFQGRGLGRRLVLAGLDYLWRKGMTVGMLYVDEINRPAVKLYLDMGFETHHVDRGYASDVSRDR